MTMTLKTRQTVNNVIMGIKTIPRAKTDENKSLSIAFSGKRAESVTVEEAVQVSKGEVRRAADEGKENENTKQRRALENAEYQRAKQEA